MEITLRNVQESDLPVLFEQQLDPEAVRMASFPSRDHDAFMAHWAKIMADSTNILKAILLGGKVAGNIGCWLQEDKRMIGYWLGRQYWGRGIASTALAQFLTQVKVRPLHAHVVKHNVASIRVLQKCGFTVVGESQFSDLDGKQNTEFLFIRSSP